MTQATDLGAIANQSRTLYRGRVNTNVQALASFNSGASEPSPTYAFMMWADTAANKIKQRNSTNTAWLTVGDTSPQLQWYLPAGVISVKSYGALGDGSNDDTTAITNAEAACSAGQTLFFPPGTYKITSALTVTRQRARWLGAGWKQTVISYAGGTTTSDIITFGNGTDQIIGCSIEKLRITSTTTMTAGSALRLRKFCRSSLEDICIDGQDGNAKLFHGISFNQVDHVVARNIEIYGSLAAGSKGVAIDGGVGAVPKADLYLSGTKIANFAYGVHVGGGFGGLFMNDYDVIANNVNLLIDESIAAEVNREMMFGQGAFDSALVGPCVDINASTSALAWIQFCGTWIATSPTSGVTVRRAKGHDVNFTGCRIYNHSIDAVEITDPLANVVLSGNSINHNGRYGVNISVSAHHTRVCFNSFTSNSASTIHDLGGALELADALRVRAVGIAATETVVAPHIGVEPAFYLSTVGTYPYINFDANDFLLYNRDTNKFSFIVNSTTVYSIP